MITLIRCRITVLLGAALTLLAGASMAQQGPGRADAREDRNTFEAVPIHANMLAAEMSRTLDAYLANLTAEDRFSGVVVVVRNGDPVFEKAYGMADRANRMPNNMQTRFNLGSINKAFTKMAIDQLVAQNKLKYSDTIATILPDYPRSESAGATVEQLMKMTAGLTDLHGEQFANTNKSRFRSNADFYDFVVTLPSLFSPGTRMQHCNGCFIVLGEMIERLSQMPYEQYMAEHVFKPFGMDTAGFPHQDAIEQNVAIGYTRVENQSLRSNVFLHGAAGSAAGGGYATAADLLAYVNHLRRQTPPGAPDRLTQTIGGAQGVSTAIVSGREWTVIVLANLDPPAGNGLGSRIFEALSGRSMTGPPGERRLIGGP